MQSLSDKLKYLRLSAIGRTLETRNQYALEHKLSYVEFLELLIEDECTNRQANAYRQRLAKSKLSEQKTLDNYDFSYQPELDKRLVQELAGCRFIDQKKNIIFMGKPGVGKTHLANAIGLAALNQGYKVLFAHANSLIDKLNRSRADHSYQRILSNVIQADLLIIDELGFRKIPQQGIGDFFEIIRSRYEQKPIIITSNRNFEEWGEIFGDAVLASAIIDRMVHHAYVFKITGSSYRVKDYVELSTEIN